MEAIDKIAFQFEIVEHIGILSEGKTKTELNLMKWNGREPQYDLRRWGESEGREVPYKGITLSTDELKALKKILNGMEP